MRRLLLLLLFPLAVLAQTIPDPIDNDPGADENTDGLSGDSVATITFTLDGDVTITGNLTITGGAIWPPPYTEPNPDFIPGPNPLPPSQNVNPEARFTYSPSAGDAPLTVNVDGSTSTDSDGTVASYSWSWGDATADGSGVTASHSYTTAGNYNLVLTVTDDDGATSITQPKAVTVTSTVIEENPVALFTVNTDSGASPLTVNVDASTSYDTDGTISSYVWDFDTGSPTSGSGVTDSVVFTSVSAPQAYTYYRFEATSDNHEGDGRWAIWNIYGYESTNWTGTDKFNSDFLSASSSSGTGSNNRAFNGDSSSSSLYWDSFAKSSGDFQWIYVRMNTAKTIQSIDYRARFISSGTGGWTPTDMKIQGSNNGTDWTDLKLNVALSDALGAQQIADAQEENVGGETFTITLTVTDDDALTGVSSKQIEVVSTPQSPVASFTVTPVTGAISLSVDVDASASSDPDGTISSYSWDWGDATANGSGATANHIYTSVGIYTITLTVTDNSGLTGVKTLQVQAYDGGLPEYGITTEEVGHRHISLSWSDTETWNKPWIIQRSTTDVFTNPTDMTNNQAADNTGAGTFRFLGINADNYIDIDGLAEGTRYYYRVGTVTNLSDHYQNGAVPTFGPWIYGDGTTTTLAAGVKLTYDITNASYAGGAVSGDGLNDWPAIDAALTAAQAAGGGIIYFPAGTYDVWPTDADVDIVDGYPEIENGESVASSLFSITSDNITFLGDASGDPTSFINLYLWGKEPATKWLNVLSGGTGSAVSNVKRYFMFLMNDVEDFTIKNLNIDAGADPVNTGKGWYSLDEKRYEWDISHKLLASFDLNRFKNVVVDNLHTSDWRGEVIYNGGGSEKILIKDSDFRRSNSSTLSGSFNLELVDTTIADSANSAVESNLLNDRESAFTAGVYPQNHIMRGCTFIGLDQSANGVMKDLPGDRNFAGWLCFNETGTYQSVTDTTFTDFIAVSFGPWYEYRNGFLFNATFNDFPSNNAGHIFYTWTSAQGLYTLAGGMSEIYWLGITINVTRDWPNHQPFFYSQPGAAALGNESPWTWEAVHFNAVGGPWKINRLWVDTWNLPSGRQNALWKDWTADSGITFDSGYLQFLGANHISPRFENFLQ